MYKSTSTNPYPADVEELYDLILKRWTNYNKEDTLDDGKNSLINLTENKKFDKIYEYIKFDILYKDQKIILDNYKIYCTKNITNDNVKCAPNINEAIANMQTYHPTEGYKSLIKRLKAFALYTVIMLGVYFFLIFHPLYHTVGPGLLGLFFIILSFILLTIGYYTSKFY